MKQVTVQAAKTHLPRLLGEVAEGEDITMGEDITITRSGEPVARLVAMRPERRTLGLDRGLSRRPRGLFRSA